MNNPSGQLRQLATPLRETVRGVLQTTWSNREALMALRKSAEPPAALALLDRLGAEHSHAIFTVELNCTAARCAITPAQSRQPLTMSFMASVSAACSKGP